MIFEVFHPHQQSKLSLGIGSAVLYVLLSPFALFLCGHSEYFLQWQHGRQLRCFFIEFTRLSKMWTAKFERWSVDGVFSKLKNGTQERVLNERFRLVQPGHRGRHVLSMAPASA
jgi:hypothetical protein